MIQHAPLNKWLTSDSSDDSDIKRIYSPSISFYLQVFGVLQSFWNLCRASHCTSSVPEPQRACWMGGWGCSESCDTFLGVFTCQQLAPWSRGWLFCQFIFRLSVWRIYLTSAQPITDLHTHSWPDSGARPHMPAPGWEPCGVACGRTSPAVMATLRGTAGASIFGAAR